MADYIDRPHCETKGGAPIPARDNTLQNKVCTND